MLVFRFTLRPRRSAWEWVEQFLVSLVCLSTSGIKNSPAQRGRRQKTLAQSKVKSAILCRRHLDGLLNYGKWQVYGCFHSIIFVFADEPANWKTWNAVWLLSSAAATNHPLPRYDVSNLAVNIFCTVTQALPSQSNLCHTSGAANLPVEICKQFRRHKYLFKWHEIKSFTAAASLAYRLIWSLIN